MDSSLATASKDINPMITLVLKCSVGYSHNNYGRSSMQKKTPVSQSDYCSVDNKLAI